MARTTMADLLTRLRRLIGDPVIAGTPPTSTWTDDELQDYLDQEPRKLFVRYARLRPMPTYAPGGGAISWLDFWADRGDWEAGEVLVNASYTVLTPATADRVGGHWTFSANTLPSVRIVGQCYDLYGAAADVLEAWAAKLARQFDFSTDGQSFRRSQQAAALREQADAYRAKQWVQTAALVRPDLWGDSGADPLGPVLPYPAAPADEGWR